MRVELFCEGALPDEVAAALERFEGEFRYPLGEGAAFRISHQPEYLRFFQAIGKARLWVARGRDGEVMGTLTAVERTLREDGREVMAHYLCDLKVRASARGTAALARLFAAAAEVIRGTESQRCYGVVMGGSGRSPRDYTGRVGIPDFPLLGEVVLLRLTGQGRRCDEVIQGDGCYIKAREGYVATGGAMSLRSERKPLRLALGEGLASGVLEDTLRAKRLLLEGGGELLSAHVSEFAFEDAESGGRLLRHALAVSTERGVAALFVAVPERLAGDVRGWLEGEGEELSVARAEIYGHDLSAGRDWWVDTAEI